MADAINAKLQTTGRCIRTTVITCEIYCVWWNYKSVGKCEYICLAVILLFKVTMKLIFPLFSSTSCGGGITKTTGNIIVIQSGLFSNGWNLHELSSSAAGSQPTDIFEGGGKIIVTCFCTSQLNMLSNSSEDGQLPGCHPPWLRTCSAGLEPKRFTGWDTWNDNRFGFWCPGRLFILEM